MFRKRLRKQRSEPIKVEPLGFYDTGQQRKSRFRDTAGTFFSRGHYDHTNHGDQDNNNNSNQHNVTVNVTIEQADDCLTSCIGALAGCFGKGAAGA